MPYSSLPGNQWHIGIKAIFFIEVDSKQWSRSNFFYFGGK
jgi:hypothetical protein